MSEDRIGRLTQVTETEFRVESLVGSYFLGSYSRGNVERNCHGCVVAEPVHGQYLVEFFDWIKGPSSNQELVGIDEMADWRFFDSVEWLRKHYDSWASELWEREAKGGGRDDVTDIRVEQRRRRAPLLDRFEAKTGTGGTPASRD